MKQYVKATEFSESLVRSPVRSRAKRCLDVTGALAGLVFLSPLFVLLIALVKARNGGNVFFRHPRIGEGGREFLCLKFCTMVPNGDEILEAHLSECPAARAEWAATRKLRNDPRVTPVGAVLRRLSLDELPQLVNVLKGDMSIVGPRPIVFEELENYGRHAEYYLRSRPGLTGLWQVSGRNDLSYEDRVAFDRHYVDNWSFGTDIFIIIKTIPAVFASRGSY